MKDLKIFTDNIEQEAKDQVNMLLDQPAFANCKVRIMPDVHAGKGCVIGFTANLGDKVIPNIVGVDIGCGMLTVELGKLDVDLPNLDEMIHQYVPAGYNVHDGRIVKFPRLQELHCYRNLRDTKRLERSLGTLGGGNHFIEVDRDSIGNTYLVIHTGSRNLGKQVAEYYQDLAIKLHSGHDILMEQQEQLIAEYKAAGRRNEIQEAIKKLHREFKAKNPDIPAELCYLEGKYRDMYLHDMQICQEFAVLNRRTIAEIILEKMNWSAVSMFETIHNYIDIGSNIVRKGAISAKLGERVLIPLNMRDGSIIAVGKGNEDWNCSAPHGAGRLMSRSKARQTLSLDDFEKSMEGIYTTSVDASTIDESPMSYKPADEIIQNVKDTVDIENIIKPIYNFKAAEDEPSWVKEAKKKAST